MNYNECLEMIARRCNLNLAQNIGEIRAALNAAALTFGAYVDIDEAQQLHENLTLAAGESKVLKPGGMQRVISARYQYTSNGLTRVAPLIHRQITTFDNLNSGYEDISTDALEYYSTSGDYILVGLGKALTGGVVVARVQMLLAPEHYEFIKTPLIVIDGAVANMKASSDEFGVAAMERFYRAIGRRDPETAQMPVKEKRDQVELDPQLVRDELVRRELERD